MEGRHFRDIKNSLSSFLSEQELNMLPMHYDLVGDIILLHIPPILVKHKHRIARAYKTTLGAKAVLEKQYISGEFRKPMHTLIAGSGTETIHKENGIKYKMDLLQVMFSTGNISERIRMSRVKNVGPVVDMFAGIGYFSLPIAKYTGADVIAIEKNPISFNYLKENIVLNKLSDKVVAYNMDCRDYTGEPASRIVMGYVGTTNVFLDKAFSIAADGCIIHFHQTIHQQNMQYGLSRQIKEAAERNNCEVSANDVRVVKKYSPGVVHAVVDFAVKKIYK
ncbi:MAG: class I SAM-dependent methyltransferase [Candidatus Methanofastidiosia archaeon]